MRSLLALLVLTACSAPVTEWPEGPATIPPPAAILRCADPDRWDFDWCNNRRLE